MASLKGKVLVGQSGGCTAVINQSLAGVVDAARLSKNATHIWGSLYGVTGLLNGNLIDLKAQPRALLQSVCLLPSAALGSARYKLAPGEEHQILKNLREWNVRYLFLVGGNDTADTILRIAKAAEKADYDLRALHVPKTIDNDLMETDHCPGYGSVARFAAITTQEAGLDTKAMRFVDPVKIIELMGRNSGWIVAAAALLKRTESDPPHLMCIPEVPFQEGDFIGRVDKILRRVGYCVVVISETIRDARGNRIGARKDGITQDSFGHQYVEGASGYLARLVEKTLKVRARYDKPGTIQRMSMSYISKVDQEEAYQAGVHAVKWALKGISKRMVGFRRKAGKKYHIEYSPVPLEKIPHRERYFPAAFLSSDKTNVNTAFVKYAFPLVGGQLPQFPSLIAKRVAGIHQSGT
ncbi:MAG: diphosphate--fructose-6-phosphate 1-phosphotransferase [Candidatus Omnitrophica bacterium]|nr:diphosphate--fructose-6-phosphate 1-phosphotransferase [Candidatus Omnitrophota bacterium]MDD5670153.1 diphosphate--fructose-6-phosphate 1-phosphotransferase [Candidatus Omnitrophota bacterium]